MRVHYPTGPTPKITKAIHATGPVRDTRGTVQRRPKTSEELRAMLRDWLHFGGPTCAELAMRVPMDDAIAMQRVLGALVDCVMRRILPLPAKDAAHPDGLAVLRTLPSIANPKTRPKAWAIVRAMNPPSPSSLGSASMALFYLQRLPEEPSPEQIEEAWTSILYPSGCLSMAVFRARRSGIDMGEATALLEDTVRTLVPCRASSS